MNAAELVEEQARSRPQIPAIIDVRHRQDRIVTFAELDERTARLAGALEVLGIGAGSSVIIFHPMSLELYVFLLALFRLGAVGIFVDPSAGREHIERCCEIHPPAAFFGSVRAHLLRLLSPAIRRIPLFLGTFWQPGSVNVFAHSRHGRRLTVQAVGPETPALITFTSGSTGKPKAAVRTHRFLEVQHLAVSKNLNLTAGTKDLTTLPIVVLANLASGVTSVITDGDMRRPGACDPNPIMRQIERHKITSTAASPAFIERLADQCIRTSRPLTALRKIFIGGAPVFPKILQLAGRAFPAAVITSVYGSTEVEPIAVLPFDCISEEDVSGMQSGKGLLAGIPVPALALRVIRDQADRTIGRISDREFRDMIVSTASPGEIVVSGEHVLGGYLNGNGDNENKFAVDGVWWHRTGDLGYLDSRNRLWLLGRCNSKIEDGNGTLYSLAVECAAQQDPRIARSALVQVNGKRVLVLQPQTGQEVDRARCRHNLSWANLDGLITMGQIPVDKRHNAKIDYPRLRQLLQRGN